MPDGRGRDASPHGARGLLGADHWLDGRRPGDGAHRSASPLGDGVTLIPPYLQIYVGMIVHVFEQSTTAVLGWRRNEAPNGNY
jgi:hypothetical protein